MIQKSYYDLVSQTFDFPNDDFQVENDQLQFRGIDLMSLVEKYGAPFRVSYLPSISRKIQLGKQWFDEVFTELNYEGTYTYTYCTKCSHFKFVLEEALKSHIGIEISSTYDLDILEQVAYKKDGLVVANGFKPDDYKDRLIAVVKEGRYDLVSVVDDFAEVDYYKANFDGEKMQLGVRVAMEEEPQFNFYTSRMGVRASHLVDWYREKLKGDGRFELKMFHFFVETGVKDTTYFWNEFAKAINSYCLLKKECDTLTTLNIGGGLPFKDSLDFDYDYKYMIKEMVKEIQRICDLNGVEQPDIVSEYGKFTVAESGFHVYEVIGEKRQNEKESWYIINSSIITSMPDVWGMKQRFITLSLNNWNGEFQNVNIGGLTCDNEDYYNANQHVNQLFMPKKKDEKMYVGFFHTGAYQEALSGYGGISHCLIPAIKHIVIKEDENGQLIDEEFAPEQKVESMLNLLGY